MPFIFNSDDPFLHKFTKICRNWQIWRLIDRLKTNWKWKRIIFVDKFKNKFRQKKRSVGNVRILILRKDRIFCSNIPLLASLVRIGLPTLTKFEILARFDIFNKMWNLHYDRQFRLGSKLWLGSIVWHSPGLGLKVWLG